MSVTLNCCSLWRKCLSPVLMMVWRTQYLHRKIMNLPLLSSLPWFRTADVIKQNGLILGLPSLWLAAPGTSLWAALCLQLQSGTLVMLCERLKRCSQCEWPLLSQSPRDVYGSLPLYVCPPCAAVIPSKVQTVFS